MSRWSRAIARLATAALDELTTPARRAVVFVGGVFSAAASGGALGDSLSDQIRLGGVVLQVAGLVFVAASLVELRKLFRRPSIADRMLVALRRIRAAAAPGVEARSAVVLMEASLTGTASVSAALHVGPALTNERRIQRVEEELEELKHRLLETAAETRRSVSAAERRLSEESAHLAELVRASSSTAESALAGDLSRDWIGLWWLVLATVASSASDELAAFVTVWWNR